jgi:hypothetical protein
VTSVAVAVLRNVAVVAVLTAEVAIETIVMTAALL